ncbi:zwei Ig domain protein zig-8-like [Tigriopus californicus]|uniref:zwei Ig domain protein zig-8-like n=1 Tax=Tigriopus californicus TaxID=6832 RepID=UPI0027DA469A|nr:zwei Ig domain protein zig-8-like [Tigriopus californicus]
MSPNSVVGSKCSWWLSGDNRRSLGSGGPMSNGRGWRQMLSDRRILFTLPFPFHTPLHYFLVLILFCPRSSSLVKDTVKPESYVAAGGSNAFSPSVEIASSQQDSSFILPSSSFGKEMPEIVGSISTNVSASLGRTAYLKCKIKDLGHKSVSWVRHSDVSLISVGKYQYIKDPRFKILHEPHAHDWILRIQALKYSDAGLYECQVNTSPILRRPIFLNVVDPQTEILGGKDMFINQHSIINLTCLVHSPDPPAHVFWLHNQKPILPSTSELNPDGSVNRISITRSEDDPDNETEDECLVVASYLIIEEAGPNDSGVYECNPSNTSPASLTVHVLDGESPDALQTSGLSTFATSESFTFILISMLGISLSI